MIGIILGLLFVVIFVIYIFVSGKVVVEVFLLLCGVFLMIGVLILVMIVFLLIFIFNGVIF